jgi:hypothetical protein
MRFSRNQIIGAISILAVAILFTFARRLFIG